MTSFLDSQNDCQTAITLPLESQLEEALAKIGWLEARSRKYEGELRNIVARFNLGASYSKMKAGAQFSDHTYEDMFPQLLEYEGRFRNLRKTKTDGTRKIRRMQRKLKAERQLFAALSATHDQVLLDTGRLCKITCGHPDRCAAGMTSCEQVICNDCFAAAKERAGHKWIQADCQFCDRICPLLSLRALIDGKDPE